MNFTRYARFVLDLRSVDAGNATVAVGSSPVGELPPVAVRLPESFGRLVGGEDLTVSPGVLRSLGIDMFDCLFPAQVRGLYRAALAGLSGQSGLRLLLQTDSPSLAALPWEYTHDAETGSWLALDPRTPLVRYYALPFSGGDLARPASLRVLAVLAAPSDLVQLDLSSERRHLDLTFQPLQQSGRLQLEYLDSPATVERLQNALRRGVDVLHYVGHGTQLGGQGALVMEREDGKAHLVLAEEVAILTRRTGVRLICLNACQTGAASDALFGGLGPALMQAEIPAVVAMQYAMPDQSALRFTRAFYGAVVDGEPIDASVTAARIGLRTQLGPTRLEWGYPVLFMRAADGHLWADQAASSSEPATTCLSCGRTVAADARFCGNCGAALAKVEPAAQAMVCPRCGSQARAQARFCSSCGTSLLPYSPQQSGGVQISGQAKVTGIVAGQDVNLTLSSGNLVFSQGDGSNTNVGSNQSTSASEQGGSEHG